MLQILCWAAAFIIFGIAGIYYYILGAVPPKEIIRRYRCGQCGKIFVSCVDECDACKSRSVSGFNDLAPTSPGTLHYVLVIGLVIAGIYVIVLANGQAARIPNVNF